MFAVGGLFMLETSMTKNAEGAAGDLTADVTALRQDVARLAETMSKLVRHQTQAAGVRVSEAVGDAGHKIASTAADAQNRVTGLAERVTYQNAENGFCVVRIQARGHRELVTLVGHAAAISAGEWITASGNWINDRTGRAPVQSPVPQDLCAHAGRGHREVSRLGNDPRHWPGSQHNLR